MLDSCDVFLIVFFSILFVFVIAMALWVNLDPCHWQHCSFIDAEFCAYCGDQLKPYCEHCDVFRGNSGADFCHDCGCPLTWEVPGDD